MRPLTQWPRREQCQQLDSGNSPSAAWSGVARYVAGYVLLVALREGDVRLLPIDLIGEANGGARLQLGALPRGEVDVDDLVAVDPDVKPLVGPQVTRDGSGGRAGDSAGMRRTGVRLGVGYVLRMSVVGVCVVRGAWYVVV